MTIRREHILLSIPGIVLLAALAFLVRGGGDGEAQTPRFSRWVVADADVGARSVPPTAPSETDANRGSSKRGAETASSFIAEFSTSNSLPADRLMLRVVDADGNPIPDATIEVGLRPDFELPGIDDDLYDVTKSTLEVDADGIADTEIEAGLIVEVDVQAEGFASRRFRVRDPGARIVTLTPHAAVWGFVYDESGSAVEGIDVLLSHDGVSSLRALTDSEGRYELEDVTPGAITVQIHSTNYERIIRHHTVEPGVSYRRDIELRRGRRLTVDVVDPQGTNLDAIVGLVELNSGITIGKHSANATFESLRVGRSYMVVAEASGYGKGQAIVQDGRPITAEGPNEIRVRVQLAGEQSLAGRVITEDGLPVPGAWIVVESRLAGGFGAAQRRAATTTPDGRFRIDQLTPTAHQILVYHPDFAFATKGPVVPSSGLEVEIRMGSPATVQGTIVDDDNIPVAGAFVFVVVEGKADKLGGQVMLRTDEKGRYQLRNIPAGHSIRIEATNLGSGSFVRVPLQATSSRSPIEENFILAR